MKSPASFDHASRLGVVLTLSALAVLSAAQACGGAILYEGRDGDEVRSEEPCNTRSGAGCIPGGSSSGRGGSSSGRGGSSSGRGGSSSGGRR